MGTSDILILIRPIVSTRDAAHYLSCARDYVAILCRTQAIEGVRLSTGWFIFIDSIEHFVADRDRRKEENRHAIRAQRLVEFAGGQILSA